MNEIEETIIKEKIKANSRIFIQINKLYNTNIRKRIRVYNLGGIE